MKSYVWSHKGVETIIDNGFWYFCFELINTLYNIWYFTMTVIRTYCTQTCFKFRRLTKVKTRVDQTDCATLVIFDRDYSTLFNKSCADLLAEHEVAIQEGQMAPELASLIGKTYLFKMEIKADFSTRFEQSFCVRKICLDPAIIKEFMSKWDKEEASFLKLTNESASLSVLLDKGNNPLHIGESSLLSQEPIPLSEPVEKIQLKLAKAAESASDVVKQETPLSASASSSSKRASPTNDDDDMNVPIKKLLRRTVKIEKI